MPSLDQGGDLATNGGVQVKYLGVLFTTEGRMEQKVNFQIVEASAEMQTLNQSFVVTRELSRKSAASATQPWISRRWMDDMYNQVPGKDAFLYIPILKNFKMYVSNFRYL